MEKKVEEISEKRKEILEKVTNQKKYGNIFSRLRHNVHLQKKVIFFGVVGTALIWFFSGVPLPTTLGQQVAVSSKIMDRNGKLIYEVFSEKKRSPIKISELPDSVKNATVSIEDKDFYKHSAFSPTGILRAIYSTVFKRKVQGGSTLTQQLVRTAFLTTDRSLIRKAREFFLAMIVEAIYTKDQILEAYLNQVPYGGSAYGIEAASELYFDKPAKDLTLPEASLLAGLTQAPTQYSPFGAHPELAKQRQEVVLQTMVDNKYISFDEATVAKTTELKFATPQNINAPHFALWIKDQLARKYGDLLVEEGGLRVTTTLDLDLQNFAQDAVATEVGKLKKQNVGNGALIATRPGTGEILAMVGSKDYFAKDEDGQVNVILANRQPGSSIKPLNYGLAIKDKKITPATIIADVPTCFVVAGQPSYCPTNYDHKYHGGVAARFALGNSFNIPAVRVLDLNGIDNFINFATSLGITTFTDPSQYGLSLTLGGGEVRPYDMAEAYGVFANQGIKEPLTAILKVTDWKGKVYEDDTPKELEGDRVLGEDVSFLVSHILLDNNARTEAFGPSSFLNVKGHPEVSVKTGTTNDRRDNWTIGYTGQIVVVTWVGNNDNSPMSGAVSGVSGASPIWNKVIKFALDKSEKGAYNSKDEGHAWPKQPSNVVGANVCATTGARPTSTDPNVPNCPARFEYFLEGTVPAAADELRQDVVVYKDTHMLAGSKALPEQVQTENHPVLIDPLKTLMCLDCPLPTEPVIIRYP